MYATIMREDNCWSIISLSKIEKSRFNLDQYRVGQEVTAKYQNQEYQAVIQMINGK